jgi:hypothetical protein
MGPGTSSGWLLGVDFGTSNTAAGHNNELTGTVQALPLSHNGNLMSSSVFVTSPAQIDVGDVALNKASADPAGFIAAPKRLLTLGQSVFQVGGMDVPAHTVAAGVLRTVLARAQGRHEGRPPSGLVLTHPENWSAQQVRVLTDAAAELGYPPQLVRTVSEPRAAAHYYARNGEVDPGDRVAVFDFGGGTLDVAVLAAARDGSFDVVAAQGDNALGGRNFDAAIRRWVDTELSDRNPALLSALESKTSVRDLRTLDESIRNAKEVLSESPQASIDIYADGEHEVLSLTRGEFESLIEREVTRGVELARATFRGAGVDGGTLRAIYLTGGSSRIPMVHQQVQSLGRIATLDDPKTVVAQGALLSAMSHGRFTPPPQLTEPMRRPPAPTPQYAWSQPPLPGTFSHQWNQPAAAPPQWAQPPGAGQVPNPTGGLPQWGPLPQARAQLPSPPGPPPRSDKATWAWIAVAAVLVAGVAVAIAVVASSGSGRHPAASTTTPAAGSVAAGSSGSSGSGDSSPRATDSAAAVAALPSALRAVSNCQKAKEQELSAQGIVQMDCTIPASTAQYSNLFKYRDIDQDYQVWIDVDPAKTIADWRSQYGGKTVEDDAKFVAIDDSYDPTFVSLLYENTSTGLHLEADGFGSKADAQTFVSNGGL